LRDKNLKKKEKKGKLKEELKHFEDNYVILNKKI